MNSSESSDASNPDLTKSSRIKLDVKLFFPEEHELVERAESIVALDEITKEELLDEYKVLLKKFKNLLRQTVKITRISDSTQSRLLKVEGALMETKKDLENQNNLKDKFMKIASHDLRGPLSGVLTGCQLLLRRDHKIENPDKIVIQRIEAIERIQKCGKQMLDIIEEFLDYNKAQSGQIVVKPKPMSLHSLAQDLVDYFTPSAHEKSLQLILISQADNPLALGDEPRIRQVFSNYISNAIKFSPPSKTITITVHLNGFMLRASIQDQGPGVKPEERNKLFTEFGKTSNLPTAGEKSTGLGLSIVKRLIEAHSGQVGAEFPENGGSIFWFELPVHQPLLT